MSTVMVERKHTRDKTSLQNPNPKERESSPGLLVYGRHSFSRKKDFVKKIVFPYS